MRALAGTSGFAYTGWRGAFYPEDLPQKQFLSHYASRLPAVEINNTFYRMPRRTTLASWSEQTPDHFRFVLKASRRITHFKKLRDVGEEVGYLLDVMGELGPKLGPTLFQTPPYLKKDLDVLRDFCALLPGGFRAAFEFRNASWLDEEVYELLRQHALALVAAEGEKEELLAVVRTAPWGYLRLRQETYDDAELDAWVDRIREQDWTDVYVFFKHEDAGTGPRTAERFLRMLGEEGA